MVGSLERAMGVEMEGEDEHPAARLGEAGQLAEQLAEKVEPPVQEERVMLGDARRPTRSRSSRGREYRAVISLGISA
jgi:hypothetical protein